MKRLVGSGVVAVVVLGFGASIASAAPNGVNSDFTKGTVKGPLSTPVGTFQTQTTINAQTTAEATQGRFSLRLFTPIGNAEVSGDVTCLTAVGNSSSLVGRITSHTGPFPPGSFIDAEQIIVRSDDNGEGGNDPPDAVGAYWVPRGTTVTVCPFFGIPALPQPQGNITVHDGI